MAAVLATNIDTSVGTQIREARMKKGMTQKEISKLTGIDVSTICKYETGKKVIPEDRQEVIFECLGLGEKKIADFFGFKETKTPAPVQDTSPDKFGPNKNHEGYADPTMAAALRNANIKYTDHMPGEMWLHERRNGAKVKKLILTVNGNVAMCISAFASGSQLDCKIKTKSGNCNYIALDRIEAIPLKELTERTDIIPDKYMDKVRENLVDLLGIKPIEKEVKVEVPVEKIVEKEIQVEVPVEKIVEKEVPVEKIIEVPAGISEADYALAKKEAEIWKYAFECVCGKKGAGNEKN